MRTMTEEQAYAAMYHFLKQFYQSTKSDDVGSLLGVMSLLPDGEPADSRIAEEWEVSVKFALGGGKAGSLKIASPKQRN